MIIDINGEKCECGNRGCLQTIVSGKAIAERGKKRLKESTDSLTAKDLFEMAENGCQTCIELFQETGVIIGIGLTNFIHLVNPGKIVLGGGVMKGGRFILPAIRETIQQKALTAEARQTEVTITKLGDEATLYGAVSLLLAELFDPVLK